MDAPRDGSCQRGFRNSRDVTEWNAVRDDPDPMIDAPEVPEGSGTLRFFPMILMVDPGGIANWSVTHVDWSEGKWHSRSYRAADVTYELFKNITSVNENFHKDGDDKRVATLTHVCGMEQKDRATFLLENFTQKL
ncbi:uncharacterized protein C2845_PM15G09730 [Panicum miliaceum]|uniref:Uncharacterized protein n=1 Tax=Panicum miliaceum TaxID=4540 RepID=A0A3L6Q425_PANMI|nr:uncharacterized protein C2845_PM15G09730 [Panicum miliaceum]